MNYTITAGMRSGEVAVPASKSCAHRQLICAALSAGQSVLSCDGISKDIEATVRCLTALGADIHRSKNAIRVDGGIQKTDKTAHLYCGESGSTLRFLLPLVGALGQSAVFHMEGKLPCRPLDALTAELTAHGMTVRQDADLLFCDGQLTVGAFTLPGNISSQYISGLLFALPLLPSSSTLSVTGKTESQQYIVLTEEALLQNGIAFEKSGNDYKIPAAQTYHAPQRVQIERDWSNAAFFLCMGALSERGITGKDLPLRSKQGDRQIVQLLQQFGAELTQSGNDLTVRKNALRGQTIDAAAIPDLVPTLAALAAGAEGTTIIKNAGRLRLKESDRLETTTQMLFSLGADIRQTEDGLVICGKPKLNGGTIDAANDHRIAMAAAVAAGLCSQPVTVLGAQCVEKSYPDFWRDLEALEVAQ